MADPNAVPAAYVNRFVAEHQGDTPDWTADCRLCGDRTFPDAPFELCAACILQVARYLEHVRAVGQARCAESLEDMHAAAVGRLHDVHARSVVYYVRRGDRIKIGTTTNLTLRMGELRPDEILATEPGGRSLEQQRHAQFGHLRVTPRGEWFTDAPDLREHIEAVRAGHGVPQQIRTFV